MGGRPFFKVLHLTLKPWRDIYSSLLRTVCKLLVVCARKRVTQKSELCFRMRIIITATTTNHHRRRECYKLIITETEPAVALAGHVLPLLLPLLGFPILSNSNNFNLNLIDLLAPITTWLISIPTLTSVFTRR